MSEIKGCKVLMKDYIDATELELKEETLQKNEFFKESLYYLQEKRINNLFKGRTLVEAEKLLQQIKLDKANTTWIKFDHSYFVHSMYEKILKKEKEYKLLKASKDYLKSEYIYVTEDKLKWITKYRNKETV